MSAPIGTLDPYESEQPAARAVLDEPGVIVTTDNGIVVVMVPDRTRGGAMLRGEGPTLQDAVEDITKKQTAT